MAFITVTDLSLGYEPVSGLDQKVTAQMYDLIEGLNKEGTTIIMISHDILAAVRYASPMWPLVQWPSQPFYR